MVNERYQSKTVLLVTIALSCSLSLCVYLVKILHIVVNCGTF